MKPRSWRGLLSVGTPLLTFALVLAQDEAVGRRPAPIIVTPSERVLVQRGFVPVDGELRLNACVIGTPAGVHYAYDLDTGTLLSVWRGAFVDMMEMWGPRARNQTARPAGDEVPVMSSPLVAQFSDRTMIEYPKAWPSQPAHLYSFRGYEVAPDGQPTFLSEIEDLAIRDHISPAADGRSLTRRLEFSGRLPEWQTWILIAEGPAIRAGTDERSWTADEGRWTVRWVPDAKHRPVIRGQPPRQQLTLQLERTHLGQPMIYSIHW